MDANTITVLTDIKNYCENRDNCKDCPFYVDNVWAYNCIFSGPHIGEGVVPADWDLESINKY